jgi:hypothetical protein
VFCEERLVQSADLAAFLVLQLKELARLAAELGDPAQSWDRQADDLLAAMLAELWDGTRFVSRGVVIGTLRSGSSLLVFIDPPSHRRLKSAVPCQSAVLPSASRLGLRSSLARAPAHQRSTRSGDQARSVMRVV